MNIKDFFAQYRTHPVLFVGTGLSLRYYKNSYTWDELLKYVVEEYSGNVEHYLDLKSTCQSKGIFDYPKLGSLIEKEFNENASQDRNGKFKAINDTFYREMSKGNNLSRFNIFIAELLSKIEYKEDVSKELAELKKARKNVGSVITTNYDKLIEDIFEFNPLIGNDILLSNPYGAVYKIHGSVTHPADIIITDEDYCKFKSKYELIRAQLLSLFIHNPIIFLGYAIGDTNIKEILKTIFSYVEPNTELAQKIRNNFLLVEYEKGNKNLNIAEHDIDIEDIPGTIRINKLKTDNFIEIYKQLSEIILPISAMDVRKVQSVVKEIYAGGSIKVMITESLDDMKNSDRILAIGSSKTIQYQYMTIPELIQNYFNIIEESNAAMLELLNKQAIPKNQYFPIFAFSTINKRINDIRRLKKMQEDNINKYLVQCEPYKNSHNSIRSIIDDDSIAISYKQQAIMYAVGKRQINLSEVELYLRSVSNEEKRKSKYRRLLCLYDIIKYKK